MRHFIRVGTLLCALTLAAGCGDDGTEPVTEPTPSTASSSSAAATPDDSADTASPTDAATSETPEPEGTVIQVMLRDGQVTPNGERVDARAGEPIIFEIDADAPGELHAHSTPDHEIEFEAGTSTHEIVIDRPGIVEVELHEPELVVVQLEVR